MVVAGFSCCGAQALGVQASVLAACRLNSCGAWAYLLWGMWDLPKPGIKPVSLALQGVFNHSTTREARVWTLNLGEFPNFSLKSQ